MSGDRRFTYDASKSDMWSCGVILYTLLTSSLPFDANDIQELLRMVCRGKPSRPLPEWRGEAATRLTSSLLSVEPTSRPSAKEVLETDEWIRPPAPLPSHMGDSALSTSLPDLRGGEEEEPLSVEEPGERRGVTMTAAFYKQLLARIAEEKANQPTEAPPSLEVESRQPDAAAATDTPGAREPGAPMTREDLEEIRMLREQERLQRE